ncbi:hypothetical protein E2K80_00485 [Rhodophyticola sp. CCM32]|uniref:hypothetical protein n=1 Tax=Rhodophyticola sp. CCM32 TaxID=2916397 RepID=UPI00107F087D|nr:hypothetical protein [Rhodophyticola sp. CCM32]QBX99390.1 hypothetical protein E2K80_00485 [Rhodophyticola sp. CCM32]
MSDAAKSEAIEDVLSSIRRLVSEHHSDPDGSAISDERAEHQAEASEKLVLTPALRVSEAEDTTPPVGIVPDISSDLDEMAEDTPTVPFDTFGSGLETPIRAVPDADEDTTSETQQNTAADTTLIFDDHDATDTRDATPFEPEHGDTNWPDLAGADAALDIAALRQARDGNAISDPQSHIASDGPEDTQVEADGTDGILWQPDAVQDSADEAAAAQPEPDEITEDPDTHLEDTSLDNGDDLPSDSAIADMPAEAAEPVIDQTEETEATTEDTAAESAEDETTPEAETTEGEGDAFAATPVFSSVRDRVVELGAELDGLQGDHGSEEVEDLGEDPGLFTFPDTGEAVIDEDLLREIVGEVVREELKGMLGQRITRNVRKMVRREIRQALAAEGLE